MPVTALQRGPASARFEIGNDGIVDATIHGLLVPGNVGALSAATLEAAAAQGGIGIISSAERCLVALPPIDPAHYRYVRPDLCWVPVAVLVTAEQLCVYERIARAAAPSGVMRRAFLSRELAQAWLRQQVRALATNRIWWSARR